MERRYKLQQILDAALYCCNVSQEEWEDSKNKRKGTIVRVKEIVSFLAYKHGYSCDEIGRFLRQDRSTILYHVRMLKDAMEIYPSIRGLVDVVAEKLDPLPIYQTEMAISCWLARSSTGLLTISPGVPEKLGGYWMAEGSKPFPSDQFPQVTYETGPVKVKIKVTLEEDEKM